MYKLLWSTCCVSKYNEECGRFEGILFLRIWQEIRYTLVLVLDRCTTLSTVLRFAGIARASLSFNFLFMKSCGVSLTAAAAASALSRGVAGTDEEKMASGTATEIKEDFLKLTAQEKQSLVGTDRLGYVVRTISFASFLLFVFGL